MAEKIIGREEEQKILRQALVSKEAELLVIYGRRRVGKTFLIRNYFRKQMTFEFTGACESGLSQQLYNFSKGLQDAMASDVPPATPVNWEQAFTFLTSFLKGKQGNQPLVVLFDEFPWIHTAKSGFLSTFEHWWNTWASRQPQIKVILCGSAASWMIENIINSKGGLHNRITRAPIQLMPFTLYETKDYLVSRGIKLDNYQVLELYMAMGGVPQYLKQVSKGESTQQVIDRLFFASNAMLKIEFKNLYQSLFANASHHENIVRALAKKGKGLSRVEILAECGLTDGGGTTRLFDELEQSGFITHYIPFEKTSRDTLYKLTDEYSLFYLKFVERARATGAGTWEKIVEGQSYNSWSGFAFEAICQKHVHQIKRALKIKAYTEVSPWRYGPGKGEKGTQIDLLLDRRDRTINICEMKFATGEFAIDKKYAAELENKEKILREQTKTKKAIFLTMITTYGVKHNEYYDKLIQGEANMDDLFR
ncbi:MAG: ATP-binding protein [Chitinophagaceae bacterium]